MAVEKSVEVLEKEITCAICHEHYTDPKVLSCCHYYCKQCIYRLALSTGLDKPFSCPECRKNTTLPQGSVDNLQAAFFINRMKEVYSKLQRATGKVEAKCEMCSGAQAEAFCRQCDMFICAECVKQHQRMRVFASHKTSSLEELKVGGAKEVVTQEPVLTTCKLHKEPMKIYCFDCSCLICRDCCLKEHSRHNYEFITVAGPETRKKLTQHLEPLRKMRGNLASAVEEIQITKSEVKAQRLSVASCIESSFAELWQIIERRKQELLTEAVEKEAHKLECLSRQEKSLSAACAVVQSVIDYTEQCVEHSADDEIMCMHAELQSQIDREMEAWQKEGRNLEIMEEADMAVEVSCAEELKQLCQTKANITQLSLQYTTSGKAQQNAEVGKLSEITVKIHLGDGKPTKRTCVIESQLKSLRNGSINQLEVKAVTRNEYCIQYTPTVRGRHELTVTVNGQQVADSPFPVFVSVHPTQLGRPVRVIGGPCRHVAAKSQGEVVVVDINSMSVFDSSGKKMSSRVLSSDYDISNSYGMAVDSADGCTYVVDSEYGGNIKIVKLSPDLKLLCKVTLKKGSQPRGVTVVGDEVMVCDCNNCVMVYTKELKYVRQIACCDDGSREVGDRFNISSNQHRDLYIADSNKSRIHVFSNGGTFLHSFGQGQLKSPLGVCVSGQYVYVANYDGHNISIFTTEGEHVTSFGQKGSEVGNLKYPWGVCVDKDGFVYVCDTGNNRVQLF